MKVAFTVKAYVCGVLMLSTAMGCAALTLGRAQGAVFVGKPLDLRVQLQTDPSDELQAACMGADVYYGETLVDPARISVSIDATAQGSLGGTSAVRVTSPVLINEPVVTVNLRVGCQQKSSRRYVLFPDVATNVVEPLARPVAAKVAATAIALPKVGSTPQATVSTLTSKSERPAGPEGSTATNSPAAGAAPYRAPAHAKVSSKALKEIPKKARAPSRGKPHLELDSLDLSIERDPVLQVTPELLTLPQDNAALRAQAAALWHSLNVSPEELLLEDAKTKAFEKDLKSLYEVTAENQKGLMTLVSRVQKAESERYANGLVYALAALCLLLLLVLALVWRHFRSARPTSWMQGADDAQDSLLAEIVKSPPVDRPTAPAYLAPAPDSSSRMKAPPVRPSPLFAPAKVSAPVDPLSTLDFDLDAFELAPPPPSPAAVPQGEDRKPSSTNSGVSRTIDSPDLLDVRQQADFFVALGEHQRAIDVLTARIAQVGESSPQVCLDLLKIYYKLGRESEFEFMRQEFNNWFTGRVPVIDDFGNEGRSLEKYPKVIDQIVALWPDPRVLEYIENCIYHHSTDVYEPDFDLNAFRELLLLHGIAKHIVRLDDDATDSQAASLVRIAARAPSGVPSELLGGGDVAHRVGAHHRGAWKRTLIKNGQLQDPESDEERSGTPSAAMRLPPLPVVERSNNEVVLNIDPEEGAGGEKGFDFFSLR
jgi:hypothetical protein